MPLLVAPALPRNALARHVRPTLEGPGVRLRPWRSRDTAGVLAAFADPDVQRWHRRRLDDADEAARWLAGWDRLWGAGTDAGWAVADPDDRLIGCVALRGLKPFAASAKVSYWVLPDARGAGVATRAVRLAGGWAFDVLGLHRIELVHSVHNAGSCRVAGRAGFALEGTMRGHMRHVDGWHDVHLHARLHDDRPPDRCDDPVVDATVQHIIDDLTRAAAEHDAQQADRLDRWRVLEPDAGRFLWFLTQSLRATTIVEIGTSRGVSTLWLADAARATGGRVVSIDVDAEAQEHARRSVARAGLADFVSFRVEDGGAALAGYGDGEVDLLFLDAERTEYPAWWPHPSRVLRSGGVLVADNATSHPEEIALLRDLVEADPALTTTTIGVGKGELLALRR